MSNPFAARRAAFRALHAEGCFALPNPWDAGSAKRLEKLGFKALASTSAGMAWAMGKDDGQVTRDEVIAHLRYLCAVTDLPVNADFENGFAETPEGMAESVTLAIEAGVAGLSIEDWSGTGLYDLPVAVERLKAARAAIDASGQDVMLVGRTEGYLRGTRDLAPTLERLKAYAAAGADCLYAPAVTDVDEIRAIVEAVAPKPVNVLFWGAQMSVESLGALGVRRVSTGGSLAAAAWAGFDAVAKRLAEEGRLAPKP
ncbi:MULTISPECIES: isocitrate lyase/phosphoenolpyruvate mutase family protein [unclassified Caulobacter]|uniref:isocitrate lyase/PEP mutase family protein n=1 Tax=unclassified Caulobacter TaxID=2648921 RepID=UPI0006FD5B9D|nr:MULTISPECIES: isocitrate lyase/phosphoenolpyruvate mutase family protein [unclassified Caulobacter]KQV57160.1 2-methylisocitrate lyase [Caulobacter sp. Root342]KQV66732.1 2-methylisocitrate lyase [Caulobacter sp. Root343]